MNQATLPALVAGTGFGCRIQIPALRAAGFNVVGLVGTDPQRTGERAEANGVANAFTDLDEAITATQAVAVAISTPPHVHGRLALAAISRGCHVICEKPFARDVAEARAILGAARAARVVHLIGHEFRWTPQRAMLGRLLAEGAIGEPRLANFTSFIPYLINPTTDMPSWWFEEEAGGGWLGAAGSHVVDWIRTLLGDFQSVSASLQSLRPGGSGADDTFSLRFTTSKGAEGILQQSAAAWGPPLDVVRIIGSSGTLWMDGDEIRLADASGSRAIPVAADLQLPALPEIGGDPRHQSPKWQMLVQLELQPYVRLCEAFKALIEGRSPPKQPPIPTFADGVACMEVLDAIRASAANRGELVKVGATG